jgi:hypothetical protein
MRNGRSDSTEFRWAHTILDEGIDHTVDLIQETGAINAVLVYRY